jgi:prevent-host-death family protein
MDAIGPISEVRAHLPEVVNKVRKTRQRFVITRQGKAVVVMISPEELETLEIMADAGLIKSLIRAEEDIRAGRLYSHKEVFGA